MVALDIQDGHLQDGFVTNINLYWAETATISLDNDSDLQEIANSDAKASPNLDILATDVSVTSSGIPIGVITSKMPGTTVEGVKFVVYYKQFYLKAYTGVLTITLTTTEELKDVVIPGFDAIIETIKTGVE
jgi:hypothetical protein